MSTWAKATCRKGDALFLVGIARKHDKFDGIYLARRDGDTLLYASKVERGYGGKQVHDLETRLLPFRRRTQPLTINQKPRGSIPLCWLMWNFVR
jgi:bifunctional non-homologous end joining protein LigD